MSAPHGKLSLKDKITSHLPGHKNQDKNMNGVPDRLEKSSTTGTRSLNDLNGNGIPDSLERNRALPLSSGAAVLPGTTTTTTTTTLTKDANGRALHDNILKDKVVQQETVFTEPALIQAQPVVRSGSFTDLNRNGIPDQLEVPMTGAFVDVREAPVIVEKIEKPTVIHEVIKTEEVVEIQPVIEREREKLDVYEVVQPMREREVVATEVRTAVLPAQTRAAVIEDQSAFLAMRSAPSDFSTREVAPTLHQTVQNAPIVHETIIHKVIEEVQPVLYKEIDRPVLIKETLPIYEKIVEAPHAHHQVLPMRDLGVRTVVSTGSYTDLNRDGIPDQLQGGMAYQTTGLQSGLTSTGTFSNDLNGNGIPDSLERQGSYGRSFNDLNGNGIPDNMEHRRSLHDLNGNGIPDRMEKAHGLKDLNGNGIDDSLERRMRNSNLNSTTY